MSHSNIEQFDLIVGKTFAALYQSFPLKKFIEVGHVLDPKTAFTEDGDYGTVLSKDGEFCRACFDWITEAGYVSGNVDHMTGALMDAVLTVKGLETLKAIPDSLQASLGDRLVDAAKTEGRELLRSLASQALGVGLQLLTPR